MRVSRPVRRRRRKVEAVAALAGLALAPAVASTTLAGGGESAAGVPAPAAAAPASHHVVLDSSLVGLADPSSSRHPGPLFTRYCEPSAAGTYRGTVAQCDRYALYNIQQARRDEGLPRMHLPADFDALGGEARLVTVTNRERRARGLAEVRNVAGFDAAAAAAAAQLADPVGPAGSTWASNWSGGYRTALAADYEWMYDDGPGGSNLACPPSGGGGCWGHRRAILSGFSSLFGGGRALVRGMWSYTQLFVAG